MLRAALFLLAFTVAAHAQPANQRAEAEAIGYLRPCHQPTRAQQITCEQNQVDFVDDYIRAKAGNVVLMAQVANDFGPRNDPRYWIGLPENPIQACAWRILSLQNPAYKAIALRVCSALSDHDHAVAYIRAGQLAHELNAAPTSTPAPGWQPAIPWITAAGARPIDRSKLEATVTPLH